MRKAFKTNIVFEITSNAFLYDIGMHAEMFLPLKLRCTEYYENSCFSSLELIGVCIISGTFAINIQLMSYHMALTFLKNSGITKKINQWQ